SMMENAESTVGTLRELKSLDVGLSIDDFGTGYSSLSYLHRFPTDSVKIDRSFVARVNDSPRDRGLIRTIVDLGHDLGMRVVAEGVESSKQAEALSELHCECAQGYFYSAPVSRDEATEYLRRGRTW
ncbi:MAG: EAL domain-containing protein, partial [Gemmatimonadota bacterium]|nr:EAL domain-containing protein [Gemmatimonadota bacterium]